MKTILKAAFVLLMISGCYYDNFQEIHPTAALVKCDTSSVITYTIHMQPIFNQSCGTNNNSCHMSPNSDGHYGLATYSDALKDVSNGVLIDRLTTTDNSLLMPKNAARLPDCIIDEVKRWVDNGAPE